MSRETAKRETEIAVWLPRAVSLMDPERKEKSAARDLISRWFCVVAVCLGTLPGHAQADLDNPPALLDADTSEDSAGPASAAGEPDRITPDEAPAVFLKAAEAYRDGRYPEAGSLYRSLIESGFNSGDLRYNLGNALLRSGELGRAIAEYRRAEVLAPRDQNVRANLTFARSTIKDLVTPPQPAPWAKTFFFWHYALSMSETLKLLVGLGGLLWGLVAGYLLSSRMRVRWPMASVLLVVVALTVSAAVRWRNPQRVAVVLPAQTDVYSGIDLQSRVIFNLHAGTELQITSSDSEWTQFRMPDGQRGWLPSEHLEIVSPLELY